MRPLIRLIYASSATALMRPQDEWTILEVSRRQNPTLEISGLLTFDAQYFCQYLEGQRDRVSMLFQKICLDRRHERIELIVVEETPERMFERWAMAFAPNEEAFGVVYARYFGAAQFDPYRLGSRDAAEFFKDLRPLLGSN